MPTVVENQFVHNYSKLLVATWTDRTFLQRLETQPTQVLKEYGIAVPPDATVNIVKDANSSEASLETQVQAWQQAETTKTFTLYVPQQPQLGQEMSGDVAGDYDVQDASYCCCCCPCCTCT